MTKMVHASGVIFEDEKGSILVLRRHVASPEGNTWGLVGGNIDSGEDKLTAAIREVSEEINHSITASELHFIKTYHWVRSELDLTFEVYKYSVPQDKVNIKLDTNENTDHMWASPDELLQREDLMMGLYPILEDAYGK